MRPTISQQIREALTQAERTIEALRKHAGRSNRVIDAAVVGLVELRNDITKRVPR